MIGGMFSPYGPSLMMVDEDLPVKPIGDFPGVDFAVTIPAGFTFDGATIPRVCWLLIGSPFEPDFQLAACVHDFFCVKSAETGNYKARVVGDGAFFGLLTDAGVPKWRRVLMYLGVRLNSFWFYGRKAK
jgi:hypothetical protein